MKPTRETSSLRMLGAPEALPVPSQVKGSAPPRSAVAAGAGAGSGTAPTAAEGDFAADAAHLDDDLRVWPEGALPESEISVRLPDFTGVDGFNQLKAAVYHTSETKSAATSVTYDIRVQESEVGYYLSRGGKLHLLNVGRHLKPPGSRDSSFHVASLNTNQLSLPVAAHSEGMDPTWHMVRVDPGEVVTATQGGRALFLFPGEDDRGAPCPGYHLISDDRTFRVDNRVAQTHPVIQCGSSFMVNVPPGMYCKAMVNVTPILLGHGQHRVNVSGFSIPNQATCMVNVNDDVIEHGIIKIIRVRPGLVAKALINGHPILLRSRPDVYVYSDASFRLAGNGTDAFVNVNSSYIEHQTLHEVRLDAGQVALAFLDNKPYILGSSAFLGEEVAINQYSIDLPSEDADHRLFRFNDPSFRMARQLGVPHLLWIGEERIITHGTIGVIRVPQGYLARVHIGSQPVILEPRDEPYVYHDSLFRLATVGVDGYDCFIASSENVIQHGIHHIITVPSGQACRVWLEGEAKVLGSEVFSATPLHAPGSPAPPHGGGFGLAKSDAEVDETGTTRRYVIKSPNFRLASEALDGYGAWVNQSDKVLQHGSLCIITIEDGEVAVVRNSGKRQALGPGRYLLQAPTQVYEKHLYTGVRTTEPDEISTYDQNRIPLKVTFTVTYEITDPSKAANYQGTGGLDHFLMQACHSCLRASVNHTHILDMGRGGDLQRMREREKEATIEGEAKASELDQLFGDEEGEGFAEQFHAAFQHQNQSLTTQLERIGVSLIDLSIADWAIEDEAVVKTLEQLAMQTVEAQVNNKRVESDALAQVAAAKGQAAVAQARVDAENQATLSRAQARLEAAKIEAAATEIRAKMEAASVEIKAKADAHAVIARAEAEAKATELRGAAEAQARRAAMEALSHTPQEEWLRQMQEACSSTLNGASITVAPEGVSNLFALLNAGSPMFTSMRQQASSALAGARGESEAGAGAGAGAEE